MRTPDPQQIIDELSRRDPEPASCGAHWIATWPTALAVVAASIVLVVLLT